MGTSRLLCFVEVRIRFRAYDRTYSAPDTFGFSSDPLSPSLSGAEGRSGGLSVYFRPRKGFQRLSFEFSVTSQLAARGATENSVYQLDKRKLTRSHTSPPYLVSINFTFCTKVFFARVCMTGRRHRMCAHKKNGKHLRKDEMRMLHHLFTVLFRSLPSTSTLAAVQKV